MSKEELQDPLKPLSEIREPDGRQKNFLSTLENNHVMLSDINLIEDVPIDVCQLFETAKNLSLYSWFVYRFHQVSEMVAYASLEMALKQLYTRENPDKDPPMLRALLKYARKTGWLKNEDFSYRMEIAYQNAKQNKMDDVIQSGVLKNEGDSIPIEEPSEEEIKAALNSLDLVGGFVKATPELRNTLAHGSNMLRPNSIWTLQHIAEVINMAYKNTTLPQ
ncbi:hypothetical protein QFX18_20275 [Saccharophagus degradans]|uniref:hypothetical protein n=1 Tax=Saccharophagus degradans TaxID=86304 RepID=UPI0024782016|nr:hypothetical protein [Saccharophagus degradans]WGO98349.1 hypothetical protein QFX18_20275 [Saccharophagus degradans]